MADPLREGDPTHLGPYHLHGRLGAGGMGQVFLGRSRGGYAVAVKMVRPELADDAQFRRRFASEVAAARKVGGFYTAQVVDADPDADPPWLATAFIPGPSLHRAVTDHGPLPVESVAVLGAGLTEGLAAVHECGLVHRDLKPANVILAEDGPRLIDFGIARALDATSYTQTSTVLGTPAFMSPEQTMAAEVGPPSDVFSLGCVLAFAATGHSPFGEGPGHAIAYRVVHAAPDLSGLPDPLSGLVASCLAKDPTARPGLDQVLDQLAVPGGRKSPPQALTAHKTRILTSVKPEPAGAARPGKLKISRKGVTGVVALLAAIATAVLLYAANPPFSAWVSHWLNNGLSAGTDLHSCFADVGDSVVTVPCWSAAAEYTATSMLVAPTSSTGEHRDPRQECARMAADSSRPQKWDRAYEVSNPTPGIRYIVVCLKRL